MPRDRTGALDIAIDGLDAGGATVANGAGTIDLHVGDNVTVTITLHTGASLCGNGQIDAGEVCDDGDRLSSGSCDYLCQIADVGPGRRRQRRRRRAAARRQRRRNGRRRRERAAPAARPGRAEARALMELLTSGGFDGNNSRWTQVTNGRALIYDQIDAFPSFVPAPHTPTRLAWLGYDAAQRHARPAPEHQIPADALQVNISGYFRIQTDEGAASATRRSSRSNVRRDGGVTRPS